MQYALKKDERNSIAKLIRVGLLFHIGRIAILYG